MTRDDLAKEIERWSGYVYFNIFGVEYSICCLPLRIDISAPHTYDRIGICDEVTFQKFNDEYDDNEPYDPSIPYIWFVTLDELLEKYCINEKPLAVLLDKIENLKGVAFA